MAYELDDGHPEAEVARSRLSHRERWFELRRVPFWCAGLAADASGPPLSPAVSRHDVDLFIGTSEGPNYMGDAPPDQLAREIAEPRGPSGSALEFSVVCSSSSEVWAPRQWTNT